MDNNDKEKPIQIEFEREGCIGAGVCAAVAPDHWAMDADGKANLLDSVKNNGIFEKSIGQSELDANKQAADGCPVQVIRLYYKKTGEKIR